MVEPIESPCLWERLSSPISIVLLGSLILMALSGLVGGQPSTTRTSRFDGASVTIKTPHTIRNGEFFESQITVDATADLENATLAITPGLWRDMTINTMIPAATEERFAAGAFRFSYGPLPRGEVLRIKIDGQVNPPLFAGTSGEVRLYDGARRLGAMPVSIRVMP